MNRSTQHANRSDDWVTPEYVLNYLYRGEMPEQDVCAADARVARATNFITPERNALRHEWDPGFWCNPPFSKAEAFIKHAYNQAPEVHGFMLLPASVGTAWFADLLEQVERFGDAILFWPKRIQFLDPATLKPYVNKDGKRSGNTGGTVIVAINPSEHPYPLPKGFVYLRDGSCPY